MRNAQLGWTFLTLAFVLGLMPPSLAAQLQDAEVLLQRAMHAEQVDGDLEQAISLYRQLVEQHGNERPVAAQALLRIGECYEKLGREGAASAYERLLSDYADQADMVAEARARLAALRSSGNAAGTAGITTRRLWAAPNAGAHDVTPDGRYLVWSDVEPNVNLALRDIATGENTFLTHDGRVDTPWANSYSARISPDGKWVAHGYSVQDDAGSLRIVGIDGENLREIRKEKGCWVHLYDWTSDGEHIAARWACWSEANPQGEFTIILVSVADGSAQELHELPNVRTGYRAWLSPDDQYLVYSGPVEQDDGNSDIWILPLSGGDEVPLIQHPADDRLLGWVPGADRIVFLSDRLGTWDLWTAGVRDGAIVEPPRRLQRDLGEVEAVGFSENGSLFYSVFTRWFSTSIAPVDVATGTPDLDAATPLLGSNRGPRWSPDGQLLAFTTESELTEGKYGRINIRDLTTGEQREVATHIRTRHLNGWSPDGASLLLGGDDGRDEPHIWKVDVSSGEGTPLLPVPDAYEWWGGWTWADWCPDGEGILFSVLNDGAGQGRLTRRDLVSGEEQELYRDSLLIRRPFELSPDGRQVAFVFMDSLNAEGPGGLAILDLDTRERRRIVTFGDSVTGWEVSLQWTPEGNKILYSEIIQGDEWDEWHTNVYRVAASGGAPEYLWTFGQGKWGGWFELSPDGRQIALTIYTQETEIWVMENLREVLQRER